MTWHAPLRLVILQVTVSLLLVTDVYLAQSILEPPVNIAVRIGGYVRLTCVAEEADDILEWRHFLQHPSGTQIWVSSRGLDPTVQPTDQRFHVLRYRKHYDLAIVSASMAEAGTFQCHMMISDIKASAEVVVLDALSCLPSMRVVAEGDLMTFECSARMAGFQAPNMEWWHSGEKISCNDDYDYDSANNTVTLRANVTATTNMNGARFQCRLFFTAEYRLFPPYTDNCSTRYNVLYSPRDMEISPIPDLADGGVLKMTVWSLLTCTAKGNPKPTYQWAPSKDGSRENVRDGGVLFIARSLMGGNMLANTSWTCRATNVIHGQTRIVEQEVTLSIIVAIPPTVVRDDHVFIPATPPFVVRDIPVVTTLTPPTVVRDNHGRDTGTDDDTGSTYVVLGVSAFFAVLGTMSLIAALIYMIYVITRRKQAKKEMEREISMYQPPQEQELPYTPPPQYASVPDVHVQTPHPPIIRLIDTQNPCHHNTQLYKDHSRYIGYGRYDVE